MSNPQHLTYEELLHVSGGQAAPNEEWREENENELHDPGARALEIVIDTVEGGEHHCRATGTGYECRSI